VIPALATFTGSELAVVLALAWVGTGTVVALRLHRAGASSGTAVAALGAWPLLLGEPEPVPEPVQSAQGPLGTRIAGAFAALADALDDPSAGGMASAVELAALRRSLEEADRRLALVDTLLAEAPQDSDPGVSHSLQRLRRARAHAASEAEAVLSGVLQLRIQVGLLALAGDALPVRERLLELRARVAALDELTGLESAHGS
jgi:hypothetical protein